VLTNIQSCLARAGSWMPIGREDDTSEYRLMDVDMEGDFDMTVREDKLNEKVRPLID